MNEKEADISYDPLTNGENEILEKLSPLNFKTIFDVGCNIGKWSLLALHHFPEAHIHTFELSSETFKTTSRFLAMDSFVNNNLGLSNKKGKITYKDYGPNADVNTLVHNNVFFDNRVKPALKPAFVSTGDVYCAEKSINNIDFLKIDVEGAENLVLEGFSGMLTNRAVRVVQFEYGYAHGDAKFLMRDFFDLFRPYGYRIARLKRGSLEFNEWTYAHNDFNSGPNYVAVKEDDQQVLSILRKPL